MLKHVYKTMGLIIIFIASLWFFGKSIEVVNVHKISETVSSEGETFPVVSIFSNDKQLNRMYGYSSNIAANTIRESITVVDSTKQVKVAVKEHDTGINKVAYELRNPVGELLDSGAVSALDDEEGYRTLGIKFNCELQTSKEYSLKLVLVTSVSKKINYYTRIKYYPENCHLKDKLDFAMQIHDMTITKDENVAQYLEPDGGADNSTLAYADIKSAYKNVTWGDLKPKLLTDIVPTVKEINMETAAIQIIYYATAKTDSGTERFYVKEYYRVKYTTDRMYLLWFERTLESDLDETLASLNKSQLNFGITNNTDMQIVANDAVTRVAFVKNSDLYMYDLTTNELNKIYSQFIDGDEIDHELYRQQEARIISMDEEGNVTFALYGYISHGVYEGKVAILLYRYHVSDNALEELLYIPFETSYQVLKENFDKYCYINGKDIFYFIVNGQIYSYNIISGKLDLIANGVTADTMTIIRDLNVLAWEENDGLSILNLESGQSVSVTAGEGEYIKLVGSISGNIVYLKGSCNDRRVNAYGDVYDNMRSLEIIDTNGGAIKTYKKKNLYIRSAYVEDNIVYINRVKKEGRSFIHASSDNIINREAKVKEKVALTSRVSDKSMTEWYMSFPSAFVMEELPKKHITNRYIINEEHVLYLEDTSEAVKYYVYAKGDVTFSSYSPAEAVVCADLEQGVVINSNNQMVWERGGRFNSNSVSQLEYTKTSSGLSSIDACVYMLLRTRYADVKIKDLKKSDDGIMDIIGKYINEPLNLTGCTLDEVLYMVSGGSPVIAMKDKNHAVLITGYTQSMVTIYDPETGLSQDMYHAAADTVFESAGNIFYSAMKN